MHRISAVSHFRTALFTNLNDITTTAPKKKKRTIFGAYTWYTLTVSLQENVLIIDLVDWC